MNYLILFILILCILFIIIYYDETLNYNNNKHLTESFNYAHYSKINSYNFFLNPFFLFFTNPYYIELNEGDSLYIPSKMWHWIQTDTESFSITFWFDNNKILEHDKYKIKPILSNEEATKIYENFLQVINETNDLTIWNSNMPIKSIKKLNGPDLLSNKSENTTFITLDGYDLNNNFEVKNKIVNFIEQPNLIKNNIKQNGFYDVNLWYTSDYHDTGMHYDDYDGILHLIKGKKRIYLYPQEDSKYLLPYDNVPDYALLEPIFMNYNQYFIYNSNVLKGKSSQFLLFKTLEYFSINKNVNKIIQQIYNISKNIKKIIWGFKKYNDTYRWEFYVYHYKIDNISEKCKKFINFQFFKGLGNINITDIIIKELNDNENIIINSFDVHNSNNPLTDEVHTYEMIKKNDELDYNRPFFGNGYDIINDEKIKVGTFIYESQENFLLNYISFLKYLDLPYHEGVLNLLNKFKSKYLCIWNKNNDLFIQWLVISINDFIIFLEENYYSSDFINYIKNNKNDFNSISNEVTIVYDTLLLTPKRSGFYGCL